MPLFAYRATDADGKELKGSIDAPSEASARQTLTGDLHLAVVEIWEASRSHSAVPSPPPAGPMQLKTSFVFEGRDAAGTVRKGTIQAETKYEAFEKLREEHHLTLSLLTPMGVKAPVRDSDLEQWQPATPQPSPPTPSPASPKSATTTAPLAPKTPVAAPVTPVPDPVPVKRTVNFTTITEPPPASAAPLILSSSPSSQPYKRYLPLLSTLRLYAGWLLAWYALFVAFGYYATVRTLPFELPLVMSFYASPLIFSVTIAVFLFLLCSSIHEAMKGKTASGIALTVIGIVGFFAVRMAS